MMATRTPKAATKAKERPDVEPETRAKPAKAAKAKAPAAKPPKDGVPAKQPKVGKPAKQAAKGKAAPKRKGKRGGPELAFEETQPEPESWPEILDTVRAKQPSFMERLRQRRAEKAERRAEQQKVREAERRAADERARLAREEQEKLRAEQEKARLAEEQAARERQAAAEKEAQERQAAEERKMRAAQKRAETRAAKEAEREEAERRAAEEAAAKAIAAEEAKARRAAERQRKREELEAQERRLAEEQAARDAEAEVEARRLKVAEQLRAEAEKAAAKTKEPEPDLEFEEASKPVKASDALVPSSGAGTSAADAQAELMAAELARRRSKPIVIVGDIPEPPKIPKAPLRPGESFEPPTAAAAPPAPEGRAAGESQPTDKFGFSIPEAFLLLANGGGWDERAEQNREGAFGGALAGAMVLELLMRGQAMVQRDRIVLTGEATEDPALAPIVARLRRIREKKGDLTSLQQMGQLAKANRDLLTPFKQRLADKGLATYGSRKHLGLFHRSWVEVVDEAAQERLQNRLRRAIAGGGTPEAASILLLGLLDAAGLFSTVVPDEAADYNRKRLNGLLGGRDIMGYKVDPELKALQEVATRAVLANVRVMTVRG